MVRDNNVAKAQNASNVWPTDGSLHHDVSRGSIYLNTMISRFLNGDQFTLLIASKGMGKTLLLRVKKNELENEASGVLIIPRNIENDIPELRGTLPSGGLGKISLWVDVWTSAIVFSILSHYKFAEEEEDKSKHEIGKLIDSLDISGTFISDVKSDINAQKCRNPSHYLNEILNYDVGAIEKFIRSAGIIDTIAKKHIKSGVCLFIDGFDQTLAVKFEEDHETWKAGQLGLIKAARRLRSENHHIKVYASIRQEAWAGFVDDDREVIKGMSIIIEHSKKDLHNMLIKAIDTYTKHSELCDYIGVKKIKNTVCNEDEEPFDYLYRHSSGTARSIIYFGSCLYNLSPSELQVDERMEEIKKCIDKAGADNVIKDYLLGQKKIFLKALGSEKRIERFLSLIPANVLTSEAVEAINGEFSRIEGIPEAESHPFCELYNIGLLGIIRCSSTGPRKTQCFKKPYEFDWTQKEILQKDTTYLLHPSLISVIIKKRNCFKINRMNVIEPGRQWVAPQGKDGVPLLFISHASIDKPIVDEILNRFKNTMSMIFPTRYWYDVWSIRHGSEIHQEVEKGVTESDVVVVIVSKDSIESGWVEKEWRNKHYEEICDKKVRVITLIIDSTAPEQLPSFLKTKKAAIFRADMEENRRLNLIKALSEDIAYHLDRIYETKCSVT